MGLYRQLLEAALDQPRPTPELKQAAAAVMKAIEHGLVEAVPQAGGQTKYWQTHHNHWLD